jgi:hypothetical protein
MGVVYKARDPQIDRLVAVKTVCLRGAEPEAEAEFRSRFLNEAQAAGRLHHPGIVSVFDVGEDPETHDPYIVLEYVAGESLNKILAREKKFELPRALQIAEEIAEALDYAHAQGVTHRDIKPGNILITADGHAKIADFGIAKLNLAHFTIPGRVIGTPAYMAPEQLSGEGADGRSDLFSLGVILYLLVTGHSPFQGNSATTVCFKVANREPIAASVLDLNLPPELDAVISRAMAKDPEERYQSGVELATDLRALRSEDSPSAATNSLQAITAVLRRTQSQTARVSAQGAKSKRLPFAVVRRVPVRDLMLGLATIALLVVVGVKSGLLWKSSVPAQAKTQPLQAAPKLQVAADVPVAPAVQVAAQVAEVAPVVHPKPALHKSSAKPAVRKESPELAVRDVAKPQPAKQTVAAPALVELSVRHQFKDATLTVWVDDQLALTRPLHGGMQKKLVVFSAVHGMDSETLKVPAGTHMLRFRAQTGDQTIDLSKTISADFAGGDDKTLLITFEKRNTAMRLAWQ